VGDAFNSLDDNLRRPVEILGLLQIATQVDAVTRAETYEDFTTVRPDGTVRTFAVPRIVFTADESAEISALNYGPHDD
jgi:hypothetical protein